MSKVIIASIILGGAAGVMLALAPAKGSTSAGSKIKASDTIVRVFTDPETGCQYLGMYGEAVTQRIAADGKTHMGCREVRRSGDSTVARS
jgi:hypothetical protein